MVEFHQKYSYEVAENWDRKLRLLWIDGDHTYAGTRTDFELFSKYLSNGAVLAFHDVLHEKFDGPLRVFMEGVLLSEKFGPSGVCGSIGWAQYLAGVDNNKAYGRHKYELYRKLGRLVPFSVFGKKKVGFNKHLFRLYRIMIPHGELALEEWSSKVVFKK
jgi:hypothetical protein